MRPLRDGLIALRFGYPNPREIADIFRPDPVLFWRLRPGSLFDAEAPVPINAAGYRGPLAATSRPRREPRASPGKTRRRTAPFARRAGRFARSRARPLLRRAVPEHVLREERRRPGRIWFGLSYAKTFVLSHLLVVAGCAMTWPEVLRGGVLVARRLGTHTRFVAASACVIAGVTGLAAVPDVRIEHVTGREFTDKMAVVGRWLGIHAPPGAAIAVNYVGAVPYFSGLRTIDMLGLTDPEIARTPIRGRFRFPGHAKGNGASVLDRRPDLILMGGVWLEPEPMDEPHPQLDSEDQIAGDPRFAADYELVSVRVDGAGGRRWFGFYKRKDVPWTP